MPYCIYLRKSRADLEAEAHGEGETLARHEQALLLLAQRQGLDIGAIYREIVSGETIDARPVMRQLLTEVGAGYWEGVLVMEVERLARGDTMDQGRVAKSFQNSSTKIITPLKTYDPDNEFDEEYFEFGLFMSRREFKTINRRIQRGRVASAKEGKYIASGAPYGYKKVKIANDKGYTLEPVPGQAQVVKNIFDWYIHGIPMENGSRQRAGTPVIAKELDRLLIKPPSGKAWSAHSIRGMLKNPVYCGKIRWGYKKEKKEFTGSTMRKIRTDASNYLYVDGIHPAIINEQTFLLANDLLASNRKNTARSTKLKNPLSGIVYCGLCGRLMTRLAPSRKTPYAALKCPNPSCRCVSAPLNLVQRCILSGLSCRLEKYWLDLKPPVRNDMDLALKGNAIRDARRQLEGLESQLKAAHAMLEQGVYSIPVFTERRQDISSRIQSLTAALESLEAAYAAALSPGGQHPPFIPRPERILTSYYASNSAAARNEMLKELLARAVYTKTSKNSRTRRTPVPFDLELFPRI